MNARHHLTAMVIEVSFRPIKVISSIKSIKNFGPRQLHHVHACVLPSRFGVDASDDPSSQLGKTASHRLGKNTKEARGLCHLLAKQLHGAMERTRTLAVLRHVGRVRAGVRTLPTLERFLTCMNTMMSCCKHRSVGSRLDRHTCTYTAHLG